MNMILKLGAGALIVGTAITAGGCANSDTPSHAVGAAAAAAPTASSDTSAPSYVQNAEEKMPRISVEEAKKLVAEGKAVLIDVRPAESYKASHIKGAPNVPLSKLESGDFKDLPKDKLIIAYCGWVAEHTSARAALLMQQKGFKDASALLGGINAWKASGSPMEEAAPTPTPSNKK